MERKVWRTIAFTTGVPLTEYASVPLPVESKVIVDVPTTLDVTCEGLNVPPNQGPVVW